MESPGDNLREELQVFVRRFGLLSASCCESCCGEAVSLVQSHILLAVRRFESPSIRQAASELGIDITTFSRQVKRLESKGLIARRPCPEDRRANLLSLTDEGSRVLSQIEGFMGDTIGRIFSAMSPFERDVVTRSLAVLNEAMVKTPCPRPLPDNCN
jgi:DNA-binding MarR family transcriptional regulator